MLISGCASTPDGYSSNFDSRDNQSNHQYCENELCNEAVCVGDELNDQCRFDGPDSLNSKLMHYGQYFTEKLKETNHLWTKHCTGNSKSSNPKVICHEGANKIEKPTENKVMQSSEEKRVDSDERPVPFKFNWDWVP